MEKVDTDEAIVADTKNKTSTTIAGVTLHSGPPDEQLDDFGRLVKNTLLIIREEYQQKEEEQQQRYDDRHHAMGQSWKQSIQNNQTGKVSLGLKTSTLLIISQASEGIGQAYKSSPELTAHLQILDALVAISEEKHLTYGIWNRTNDVLEPTLFVEWLKELDPQSLNQDNIQQSLTTKIKSEL